MRLIIEIENDDELAKLQSLMTGFSFNSIEIKSNSKGKLENFLKWCQENQVNVSNLEIPSRDERNAR